MSDFDWIEPRYTVRVLDRAIFDLPEGMLNLWIARGVLTLRASAPGSGRKRLFSFAEAVQIHVMTKLTVSYGFQSKDAAAVGKIISDFVLEKLQSGALIDDASIDDADYPIAIFHVNRGAVKCKFIRAKDLSIATAYEPFCCVLNFWPSMTSLLDNLEVARNSELGWPK